MRHGRSLVARTQEARSSLSKVGDILLAASVTKTLSDSGTRNLDPSSIPLSEPLLLHILRSPSLHPSKKIDFFGWCRSSLGPNYKHSASGYSHILRVACRAKLLHEIPRLLVFMKEDGIVVSSWTFKRLLDTLIRSGKIDLALEVLDHMEEVEMGATKSLDPHMYDSVLVALVAKNQVGLALSILIKLLDGSSSFPSPIAYNQVLVALRKANMGMEFKQVFEKLREKNGFEFGTWGYNICIHAFGCWGDLATSLGLFKEMKEKSLGGSGSLGPDMCTYNSLIRVLCLAGKVKDALMVWEELKGSGHEPDEFTYRILIQGCCKSYRIEEATKIFSEMQYHGCSPDTIVYTSLLDGMFKARKLMEACQLFEKMVQDGVRTSCWTHNVVIDGLFRNGRAEAGYALFCDLKKKGSFVDGVTYSVVVLQLCREGLLEEALRLVEEMEGRGFVVDLITVTSLLIGLHKHGLWDWTERLMKHVRDGNLVADVLKWQVDMEASLKNPQNKRKDYTAMFPSKGNLGEIMSYINSSDRAADMNLVSDDPGIRDEENSYSDQDQWSSSPYMDKLASQMKSTEHSLPRFSLSRGQRIQPEGAGAFDIDMVNTFLSIFLSKGKLSLACKLFEIFRDMGVSPVSYTYNSIMSTFVKKGHFNQAWGVLNEMGEQICLADIATYNVIIQGLGKLGRADLASAVLDKLIKDGGYLDIIMYNTLINALGKAGRIEEVNKLFEQMKTSGVNPDVVTFNTLIEVHSKAGRLKDAYKFLKMMLDAGCLPNHVTDTTLDFLGKEIDKLRYQKASILGNKDESS